MSNLPGDIANRVNDVRNTFSSWDSCMSKTYCKWPVIIGIVLGAVILLSVVWCIASCLCCGATLCGSCVRCLTCFGCCGACGNGRGGGRTRHKDDYTQMPPTPYNGYQPQPSQMSYQPPAAGPQFAQFDASTKKVHADSLPAMPTWNNSRSVRVEDHSAQHNGYGDDVEMGTVSTTNPQMRTRNGYNQVPNGPVSPISAPSNYGHFENQAHPYNSDIGAQRLGRQQMGYADFDPSPLSPAPTYRTNPTVAAAGATDRFARGAMSPTPSQYNNQGYFSQPRDQSWSPLNGREHESTDYQSYRRSLSPPANYSSNSGCQHQEDSGVKPPSLLQIGRKPITGSQREI